MYCFAADNKISNIYHKFTIYVTVNELNILAHLTDHKLLISFYNRGYYK